MKVTTCNRLTTFILYAFVAGRTDGFVGLCPLSSRTTSTTPALSAVPRKKESMAEKRARRQARRKREVSLPKRSKPVILVEQEEDEAPPPQSSADDASQQAVASQSDGMTKAQELIQRQRRSVTMLTLVKESIDKISPDVVAKAFAEQGFFVVDNFLNDEETLNELQQESISMLDKGMTPEIGNLSKSGEFVGLVRGGEEQYSVCPRAIEWVVATTKHFGRGVVPEMNLSDSNCLGRMRTFDRQIQLAKEKLVEEQEAKEREHLKDGETPFGCVVDPTDGQDQRRVSLRYYLVPSEWKYGGGIEFKGSTTGVVEAKRDRLVIWQSATTPLRGQSWRGDETHRFGSCLELDLIQTTTIVQS